MSGERANESIEIELKFEVTAESELPDAAAFAEIGLEVSGTARYEMRATYFDTADAALAGQRVAVRKREGGSDPGWHLKEKGDAQTRELHWSPSEEPPEGLLEELRGRVGDAELLPIAELRTERRVVRLASGGDEVVELADDRVRASEIRNDGRVDRVWREWEAELAAGADRAWLDRVAAVLARAGAEPSLSTAKVARATGSLIALARVRGASPEDIARVEEMDRLDREAARKLES